MWGLNRFQRPAWSTGTLIPCSFLCGMIAGVLIWRDSQKTKRVAEVEERLRAALAAENPHSLHVKDLRPLVSQKSAQPEEKELLIDESTTAPRQIPKGNDL